MIVGMSIGSGVLASIFKDSFMKVMKSCCSRQLVGTIENHIKFWSTVPVINWGNELYRWMYFTLLQGEAEVGDIPIGNILEEHEFSRITLLGKVPAWSSVYEVTTGHPYCIELRHARMKTIKPYFVQAFFCIDEILREKPLWNRQEIRENKKLGKCYGSRNIFMGLSYENNSCILVLKNATTQVEGSSFNEISAEERFNELQKFAQPFQEQNIKLFPRKVFDILKRLVITEEEDDDHKILMHLGEDENSLYIEHPKGLTMHIRRKPYFFS
jgi:hypothetical protein